MLLWLVISDEMVQSRDKKRQMLTCSDVQYISNFALIINHLIHVRPLTFKSSFCAI